MTIPYLPLTSIIVLLGAAGLMPIALLENVRSGRHYLYLLLVTVIYETVAVSLAIRALCSAFT